MKDNIRTFLASGAGRRALLSAGAYIAGAYFGYVMPGGLEALHEAFQYAVSLNPFTDPIAQITALYDGALHQTAATLNSVGDWLQSAGVEVSQRVREEMDKARALLGPTVDQTRALFCETWRSGTEAAAMLRDQIRNATPSSESVIAFTKEMVKTAIDLASMAAEAYGIYEAGKAFYKKFLSGAKAELAGQITPAPAEPPAVTEQTVNLNLNTAIGGGPVADNAIRITNSLPESAANPVRGISAIDSDQIIWVSDRLTRRVSEGLSEIGTRVGSTDVPVSIIAPAPGREIRLENVEEDLRHRDRFPIINWGESALSEDRLSGLKCGAPLRGVGRSEIRLSDQIPIRSNAKIVIGEDGFLRVDRPKPPSDTPDLLV